MVIALFGPHWLTNAYEKVIWLLNCLSDVLECMRIETKSRRDNSPLGLFAQSGAGIPSVALLVWLLDNRQPSEEFPDQICSPVSHLNFEPFWPPMRPNGLRADKPQKLSSRCETKRKQNALYKGAGDELLTGFKYSGSETPTAFLNVGPLKTANNRQKQFRGKNNDQC